jgi:phage portal protein BeeE
MGLIDKFIQNATNYFRRANSSLTYQNNLMFIGNTPPNYPDPDQERFVKDGYSANAAVYSIVASAARKFGVVPRLVFKVADKKAEKAYKRFRFQTLVNEKGTLVRGSTKVNKLFTKAYDDEEELTGPAKLLNDLMIRPNPSQGQDAFYKLVYIFYKITGEAFIWLNRGEQVTEANLNDEYLDTVPPVEMWVLPSHMMEIIPDPQDAFGLLGYMWQLNGKYFYIRKNDIIHWKDANPNFDITTRDHLRGHPPLKSGNKILQQNDSATDAMVSMYDNGGARGVLFEKSLKNISVEQKSKIEDVVSKRINNKDLKSSIANLQGDWGYLPIGMDAVDMELIAGEESTWKKLCNILGWQYELFQSDTTFANKEQAWKFATANIIVPDCCALRDEMNRSLLPSFKLKGYTTDIDYTNMPELQEDMAEKVGYLSQMPITIDEFREEIGYEPFDEEWSKVVYMDSNKVPVEQLGMVDEILMNGQSNRTNGQGALSDNGKGKKLPA